MRSLAKTWIVADQCAYAASNLLTTVLAARSLGGREFGEFSLAYAVVLLAWYGGRGYWTERVVVDLASVDDDGDRAYAFVAGAWKNALFAGAFAAVTTVTLAASGILPPRDILSLTLTIGLTAAAMAAQDVVRFGLFQLDQAHVAFWSDIAWLLVTGALIVGVGPTSAVSIIAFWGLGAAIATSAGVTLRRMAAISTTHVRRPAPRFRSRLGLSLGAETLVASAGALVPTLLLGSFDLPAAGGLRGAQAVLGPVTLLLEGGRNVALSERARPEFVRFSRSTIVLATAVPALVVAATGIGMAVLKRFDAALLGDATQGVRHFLPYVGAAVLFRAVVILPQADLRGQRLGAQLLRIRLFSVVAGTAIGMFGVAAKSPEIVAGAGVAYPTVVASLVWFAWSRR